jgi:hypothetical protein
LAVAGPAAAHVVAPPAAPDSAASLVDAAGADAVVPVVTAAPELPALPAYLIAALVVVVMVARRSPRAAMVMVLVLLLGVFAFENALHSVHHGFDPQQQEECTVAAVSAQLAAVEVADGGAVAVALLAAGPAEAAPAPRSLSRFQSPDQGRAPPSTLL